MKLLLLLFLLSLNTLTYAKKTSILLKDKTSNEKLAGIKVTLNNTTIYYSDINGLITLQFNKNDSLKIEGLSYKSVTLKLIKERKVKTLKLEQL